MPRMKRAREMSDGANAFHKQNAFKEVGVPIENIYCPETNTNRFRGFEKAHATQRRAKQLSN